MYKEPRTTLGVKKRTKDELDKYRAPGQCYDGFICQLIGLWKEAKKGRMGYMASTAGGNQRELSGAAKKLKL